MGKDWFLKLLVWREKNIKEKNFILILSFIIGILAAGAALILKYLIHFIQNLLTEHFSISDANYLYLVYPIIGILLSGLYVRYIVKDDISHGITRILYAISQRKSRLKPHNMYTSVVASSITIGFGGSVGAEAPIVYTGAAIGSNIGSAFRLDTRVLASCRMRSICQYSRNFQSTYCRSTIYFGNTYDGLDHNISYAITYLLCNSGYRCLYFYRTNGSV